MIGLPRGSDAALDPVRAALSEDVERQARSLAADAGREAERILEDARAGAAETVAAARTEGTEAGRAQAALGRARARRQAAALVLGEQEQLRAELESELLSRAAALRTDPRYPLLLQALRGQALALLGPQAVITEAPAGGLLARAGSRTLDLSLPALAGQELARDARAVSSLWAA